MNPVHSPYGTVMQGAPEALFAYCQNYLEELAGATAPGGLQAVGLSGGSTPKAFFEFLKKNGGLSPRACERLLWTVSDERCVPQEDAQSNFGEATRLLLDPCGVPQQNRLAWPTQRAPEEAAGAYAQALSRQAAGGGLHTCFLGMGEDGHTASLWPGCPLLESHSGPHFAATQWPQKGWRLTITPEGLQACGKIIVLVSGAAKGPVLKAVLEGPENSYPIQILKRFATQVLWLVDEGLVI